MLAFDLETINTFMLQKHHLTPDSAHSDIPTIVQDICGLHATGPTVPYLSLHARHTNFEKKLLEHALYVQKSMAKIRCVRKTIYIHTKEMLPIVHAATAGVVEKASRRFMEARGISHDDFARISKSIRDLLTEQEMTASAIKAALNASSDISSILYFMCDQGILIRGRPEKGWRDKSSQYALFTDYFPDLDLTTYDEKEAICLLVEYYLASFGPVTEVDILWWTGLGKAKIRRSLEELGEKLVHVSIPGLEGDHMLLRSGVEEISNLQVTRGMIIALLPYLDPYLMGYKERRRYLNPQHTSRVFDRSGNATSTILLNGRVVGVWDYIDQETPSIKLHFFSQPHPDILDATLHEAQKLGSFITDMEIKITQSDSMVPLPERSAGGFMSPLRHDRPG
jgi:hypothetical protein